MTKVPFVYLACREDRALKVGFSDNPKLRLTGLRSQFGMRFRLLRVWQHPMAYPIEQIAHRLLRPYLDVMTPGRETYKTTRKVAIAGIREAIRLAEEPPPEVVSPEPELVIDLAAIEADGEAAWASGVPRSGCPYWRGDRREAWMTGWLRPRTAALVEATARNIAEGKAR